MKHIEHLRESVERVKQTNWKLYEKDPAKIRKLLCRIHKTLDAYFDPSAENLLAHREVLHHREGVEQVTAEFGVEYENIIRYEAARHVIADMGQVYMRGDYRTAYFWERWKARNEEIICWV